MARWMLTSLVVLCGVAVAGAVERETIVERYGNAKPTLWGETVHGVRTRLATKEPVAALTFDACGGPKGSGIDRELISFLERERIPATLFVNGRWIEANPEEFRRLAANDLFEIGNHGTEHRPLSVTPRRVYGIKATSGAGETYDEVEINARTIREITGRRPLFFRAGTAFYDEAAVDITEALGHQVVGFSILGDAGATWPAQKVRDALMRTKPGDIVILHMNQPGSGTAEGVRLAVTELRRRGLQFVKLSQHPLK